MATLHEPKTRRGRIIADVFQKATGGMAGLVLGPLVGAVGSEISPAQTLGALSAQAGIYLVGALVFSWGLGCWVTGPGSWSGTKPVPWWIQGIGRPYFSPRSTKMLFTLGVGAYALAVFLISVTLGTRTP